MRTLQLPPPLDLSHPRPISPGGCPSAGDFEMGSPTRSWCGSLILPERPRTSESRRPSWSASNAPDSIPKDTWRVLPGSYVAFSLDVAGSANCYPPNSRAAEALLTFNGGRYIGLVVGSFVTRSEDDTRYNEDLTVLFVARTPPPIPEAADYFIPIAPCSDEESWERKSIDTKPLFPLKDRLQWTTFGTLLRIETFVESSLRFNMDDDEFNRVEKFVEADIKVLSEAPVTNALTKLRVPAEPVPATVWRDIRGEHREDPMDYVVELYELIDVLHAESENQ
ncbi:hypothetical protein L226DRAFT_532436 [Lentinus tigrinus ALCF2SS1-7]|uniref:Uncharacterized protein n=1 Tax=Lentinus tigrinus ALCF2SS1-6 TaxID=1328759 RepID=A0A5C2SH68_9APHY|nr:hypothetical protein L227DRAFT_430356 [Lentinus tigrinus ALCF2SS1-6]RPD77653.1 hypothetical protein L226DRAFT_532436 [Lentinus tigrinus ALCF2SS1-7]